MDKKITGGTGNGKFSPSQTCTQSQILTFLWNAQGSPEPEGTAALTGLDPEKFYYKASLWAVEQGLLEAEDCRPDEPCTRTMVVTYLWKLSGCPDAPAAAFTDVFAGDDYAAAVAWTPEQNIVGGNGNNEFVPNYVCDWGQIVTFLYRSFA